MIDSPSYSGTGSASSDDTHAFLTMSDFQRLRNSRDIDSAPLIAASIFLSALNVFTFFLRIFSRNSE